MASAQHMRLKSTGFRQRRCSCGWGFRTELPTNRVRPRRANFQYYRLEYINAFHLCDASSVVDTSRPRFGRTQQVSDRRKFLSILVFFWPPLEHHKLSHCSQNFFAFRIRRNSGAEIFCKQVRVCDVLAAAILRVAARGHLLGLTTGLADERRRQATASAP